MDIKQAVQLLKEKGRICVKDGHSVIMDFLLPEAWSADSDEGNSVLLLFEIFQIRMVAKPFSEISLDIVEFGTKPTVYVSPVNKLWKEGPILDGKIRFSLIKKDFWNKFLFQFGKPIYWQKSKSNTFDFETKEYFPLLSEGTKYLQLDPEGRIKILKA